MVMVAFAVLLPQQTGFAARRAFAIDYSTPRAQPPLPQPQENAVKPLTPAEALAANSTVPFSNEPIEAARPFKPGSGVDGALARAEALNCLATAVYYEAAGEGARGERAVAQVVLNRVRHPAFPSSVCGVVYQGSDRPTGCQFTFACDGSLARKPNGAGWTAARRIAEEALDGAVDRSVGMATHYHANYVVPYWASSLSKISAIGEHIFYRWPGYWGRRAAFTQSYSGETAPQSELASAQTINPQQILPPDPLAVLSSGAPIADVRTSQLTAKPLTRSNALVSLRADENGGILKADEGQISPAPRDGPVGSQSNKRASNELASNGRRPASGPSAGRELLAAGALGEQ